MSAASRRVLAVPLGVVATVLVGWYVLAAVGLVESRIGDGWRLLVLTNIDPDPLSGLEPTGEIAASAEGIVAVWDAYTTVGDPALAPDEGLLRVTVRGSSTCRTHFVGVGFRPDGLNVRTSAGLIAGGCTDDAIPYTFLVAVTRDRLPAPPFTVSVEAMLSGSFEIAAFR